MKVFEGIVERQFEDEMLAHSKRFTPRLSEILGDEQLRAVVRSAIARAGRYDLTYRGPIRLFLEMTFLCGSGLDTDPQYPVVGAALRATEPQMVRAQHIHEWHNEYLEKVSGPRASNVHRALRDLVRFARAPLRISANDLEGGLLRAMHEIFPEKATYVGDDRLRALIAEGVDEAKHHEFEGPRPAVLLGVLRFAFGHGCTSDPLYPWISQTLKDDRIVSPGARAERLEKKAITWLEHVVARNERGATA
jgi:hypothetical protein